MWWVPAGTCAPHGSRSPWVAQQPKEVSLSRISQNDTLLPSPAGTLCAWEEKHPQTGAAAYLAVLELKLDLGVIDHLAQIPDNHFPSSLLEQAGEPLVQVFFSVFLVLKILYQVFRENKSEPVGGEGLISGRDVLRTPSQRSFLRKAPWAGAQAGLFVVGSPCQHEAGFRLLLGGRPPRAGGNTDLQEGFLSWERGGAEAHPTFRVSQLHA